MKKRWSGKRFDLEKDNRIVTIEKMFMEWLDSETIPYEYTHQRDTSYSSALRKARAKRYDFAIHPTPYLHLFIDTKDAPLQDKKFNLLYEDALKVRNSLNVYGGNYWVVFSNKRLNYLFWYWIPVAEMSPKIRGVEEGKIVKVLKDECIEIRFDDSFETVINQSKKREVSPASFTSLSSIYEKMVESSRNRSLREKLEVGSEKTEVGEDERIEFDDERL